VQTLQRGFFSPSLKKKKSKICERVIMPWIKEITPEYAEAHGLEWLRVTKECVWKQSPDCWKKWEAEMWVKSEDKNRIITAVCTPCRLVQEK
jgi:hypothetical protein